MMNYDIIQDEKCRLLIDICAFIYEGNINELEQDLRNHLSNNRSRIYNKSRSRIEEDLLRIEQLKGYKST